MCESNEFELQLILFGREDRADGGHLFFSSDGLSIASLALESPPRKAAWQKAALH